jgi:hypothetical protein
MAAFGVPYSKKIAAGWLSLIGRIVVLWQAGGGIYSVLTRDPLLTQGQQNTGRPPLSPVIADADRIHAIFLAACEKHAGVRLLGEEEQHVVHAVFHGYRQVSDALITISSTDPV